MPAGQGKDAERFAAAMESGTPLVSADDAELARDLEIVAMLRSRGAEYAPDPEAKARAKQRLMAALAAERTGPGRSQDGDVPRPAAAPPAAAELTAPLDRLGDPAAREDEDVDPNAETALMAPVTARLEAVRDAEPEASTESDEDAATTVAPAPGRPGRAGRRARHRVANRPAGGPRSGKRPVATGLRRRALLVGSAAMVAMLAIAGGGIFASRDALPGDSLYAVKQVAESAGLALTFDDESRARRQLEIAATRLSEIEQLAARNAGAAPPPEVFTEAMEEFDAATDEGSRLLLESADQPEADEAAASDLRQWATKQSEKLSELRPALPPAAEADESIQLLDRLLDRTEGTGGEPACEGDDCDTRRTSDADARESDEADATEDATSTPDESDSPDAAESDEDEPSSTPTPTQDGEDSKLLPGLLPDSDQEREGDTTGSNTSEYKDTTTTSESDSDSESESSSDEEGGDDNVSVPLPLLPPVTLPPLLPGMPGITLG